MFTRLVTSLAFMAILASHDAVTVQDIDAAIRWLTRSAPRTNPMQTDSAMRREVALSVHSATRNWPVDPWLVLVMIDGESSFKPWSMGKKNEVGLMQVRGTVLIECLEDEFDMQKTSGQINCGVRHLHRQIEQYGELGGLIEYASGHYGDHTARTERKMGDRLKRAKRLASRPWER